MKGRETHTMAMAAVVAGLALWLLPIMAMGQEYWGMFKDDGMWIDRILGEVKVAQAEEGGLDSRIGEGIHQFQDGTVAAIQLAELLGRKVFSLGPMLEYASTADLQTFGVSRKTKYWVGLRLPKFASQLDLQTNFGFMSDELVKTDSRWVVPLGAGLNFQIAGRTSFTVTGLLNVAPFHSSSGEKLFPGITIGIRF